MKPLCLAEVKELAGDLSEKPELRDYLKEFCQIDKKKSASLAEAIRNLNNPKIKEEYLVKIVDLLPRDGESISKIFNDVSLDEKEINEVLTVVKEY
ncbi:MAG: hypothetical protein AABY16_02050 [Nanoarchaeota archaeon]